MLSFDLMTMLGLEHPNPIFESDNKKMTKIKV